MTQNDARIAPTLQDLLDREAACRRAPNYAAPTWAQLMTASQTQLGMFSYRLAPLWTWPGGPAYGHSLDANDRAVALVNLAGALQPLLMANAVPLMLGDSETTAAYHSGERLDRGQAVEALAMSAAKKLALPVSRPHDVPTHPDRLAKAISALARYTSGASLGVWLAWALEALDCLGLTIGDLCGAYLDATNALVPPPSALVGTVPGEVDLVALPAEDLGLE